METSIKYVSSRWGWRRGLALLGVGLLLVGISFWRAQPAFFRDNYATEGGEWLGHQWQHGLWQTLMQVRADYPTLGNQLCIWLGSALTGLVYGHPLVEQGPDLQHGVCCVYVGLIFLGVWLHLRRHYGGWASLGVVLCMALCPDLDGENRIFGEANNVGYFSAVAVVFCWYDMWMRSVVSRRAAWLVGLCTVFHTLTSPLAGLVAAGFALLILVRDWKVSGGIMKVVCVVVVCLSGVVVVRSHVLGHYEALRVSEEAQGFAAAAQSRMGERAVELVGARQLLYPMITRCYTAMSDGRTLGVSVGLLGLMGMVAGGMWRRMGREALRGLSGLGLLGLATVAMAVVTLIARPALTLRFDAYASVAPARYYLAQNMCAAGFVGILLLMAWRVWPRARVVGWVAFIYLVVTFVGQQRGKMAEVTKSKDPAGAAQTWAACLHRNKDLLELMGEGARVPAAASLPVEIYIQGLSIPVPWALVRTLKEKSSAQLPVTLVSGESPVRRNEWGIKAVCAPAVVYTRPDGSSLYMLEVRMDNAGGVKQRAFMEASRLPEGARMLVWQYARQYTESELEFRNRQNLLFRVAIHLPQGTDVVRFHEGWQGKAVGLVENKIWEQEELGNVPEVPLRWSCLLMDEFLTTELHPAKLLFEWKPEEGGVKVENGSLGGDGYTVCSVGEGPVTVEVDLKAAGLRGSEVDQLGFDLTRFRRGWRYPAELRITLL